MKYLSDYIQEEQTKFFEEIGLFFAFNDEQWKEGVAKYGHLKPEGTKWCSIGSGGYLPSVNLKKFEQGMDALHKRGVAQDLKENGREGVLSRELGNYEIGLCFDGYMDQNFRSGIDGYGFTEEEIKTAYNKHMAEVEY